jgi:hypothetical protein
LRHASDIGKECGALSNEFPGDSDLYKKASVGGIVADAMMIILGLGTLLVGIVAIVANEPFKIWGLSFDGQFLAVLLLGVGSVLLCSAGFSLYKIGRLSAAKKKADKIRKCGITIEGEARLLESFEKKVLKAMENGEDLLIDSTGYWETQVMDLKTEVVERTRNDDYKNRMINTIAAGLILAFACIAFYPFIVGGYALQLGNTSGSVVAVSYLLIAVIIAESLSRLDRWYGKKAKLTAVAVYFVYQIAIVVGLAVSQTFAGFLAAISSGEGEKIISECVMNYPILSMLTISLVTAFIILKPDYSKIAMRIKVDSITVPLDNGTTQTIILKRAKAKLRRKCIILIPVVIAMGVWMGKVVVGGFSFVNLLLYLLVAACYLGITLFMETDEAFAVVYGRLPQYFRLLMFVGYATIALSLVPNFGFGTIILITIHMLASFGGGAINLSASE